MKVRWPPVRRTDRLENEPGRVFFVTPGLAGKAACGNRLSPSIAFIMQARGAIQAIGTKALQAIEQAVHGFLTAQKVGPMGRFLAYIE